MQKRTNHHSGRAVLLLVIICALIAPDRASAQTASDDLEVIRTRIASTILKTKNKKQDAATQQQAGKHLETLQPDGAWPDINYRDRTRADWKTIQHLRRVSRMVYVYKAKGSELAGDARLKKAVLLSLDRWLEKDYQNPNWWWKEVGVPRAMGQILVPLCDDLSKQQLARGIQIMKRSKIGKTGQNMVWLAGNQVVWGSLAGDAKAVKTAFGNISRTVSISGTEGIKPDFSFWQHGHCLYSGGYGMSFCQDVPYYAWLAHGTAFEFSEKKRKLMAAYLLDGQQWMIRGNQFDYGAIGRATARPRAGAAGTLVAPCRYMAEILPARKAEFERFATNLQSNPLRNARPLVGNRYFYHPDFMVHHRKDWYASARGYSTRLVNTDHHWNGQSTRAHHIADGANFLMRDGDEFVDIFPVWNWLHIPGTTVIYRTGGRLSRKGQSRFVGGVSDGTYGMMAMHFIRDKLSAKKFWAFFDDEYVCLGTGLAGDVKEPMVTSVNQCLLRGDVLVAGKGMDQGTHKLTGETWIHHDTVGYLVPDKTALRLRNGGQSGSWRQINAHASPKKITRDVFSLWFDHGVKPTSASYAYIVVPGITSSKMSSYAANGGAVTIAANESRVQAVRHKTLPLAMAVFYKSGKVNLGEGLSLSVDKPCLLIVKTAPALIVTASMPIGTGHKLKVRIDRDGSASRTLDFTLPSDWKMAGSSITLPANK